jgi:hypothetical protein
MAANAALYMTIRNSAVADDRLVTDALTAIA